MPIDAKDIIPSLWDVLSKPSPTNTWPLGAPTLAWSNLYLGPNGANAFDPATGNIGFYARTAAEIAAAVTPTNFVYPPGNILRFGADSSGVTDSTTPIQNALKANAGSAIFIPAGTFKTTASLAVTANTLIFGAGMGVAIISATNNAGNQFNVTGNQCILRDFTITVTGVGASGSIGAVNLNGANYCLVQNLEISGVSWAGIFISNGGSYNVVNACYFHGFQGTVQDSADIALSYQTGNCAYNVIRDNRCFGGNEHGVMILANDHLDFNLIAGNRIGQHTTYGIVDYTSVTNTERFNQLVNNYIENIQGTTRSGQSGAGIYIVGVGGDLIQGNTIRNCCVQTSAYGLAPAGIGINGVVSGLAPINVIGNVIEGMTKFDGITVVSSANGSNVVGNRVRMPTNTTGTAGIYNNNSSNVLVEGNHVTVTPTAGTTVACIFVNQISALTNIVINDNILIGGNTGQLRFGNTSTTTQAIVTGNLLTGGGTSATGLQLANLIGATVTGNNVSTTTAQALSINACTQTRIANNYLTSTGPTSVATAGTCTGSYFDKSNTFGAVGTMSNGGTGLIVEWLASAVPGSGTWAVGDRTEQSVPVVGNPKGWRCTVAGAPGTWVSEGNL